MDKNERLYKMTFTSVYPHYIHRAEKKAHKKEGKRIYRRESGNLSRQCFERGERASLICEVIS